MDENFKELEEILSGVPEEVKPEVLRLIMAYMQGFIVSKSVQAMEPAKAHA